MADANERLTVVELFQSQGCSSCPPANVVVSSLCERSDLLVLSFGVTYWDHLGWRDTFGKPEFTARQRDYARGLGIRGVYTPQVVVNGRVDLVGSDRAALESAIRRNQRSTPEPAITVDAAGVVVGAATSRGAADVWLVQYDPRTLQVPIRRGENGGRTLPHRNVVRALSRVGEWHGATQRYSLPEARERIWRRAILVQHAEGGPLLAAARLD